LLKTLPSDTRVTIKQRIILINELVYVPQSLRQEIFDQHHEIRIAKYQKIDRTLELITRTYYFPKMKKFVKNRIRICDTCQRNKTSKHKPYGKMMPNQAPTGAWEDMALNFIIKLPESKEPITKTNFDSILVVTNRLIKYGYFIPYRESSSAEDLTYVFNKHIIGNHGIPKRIINNRNKLFTSRFWKSLINQLGTYYKMLTDYYPQTDRQTERLNQTLEQYLRHYINYQQDD
jgi:hypothetical protein